MEPCGFDESNDFLSKPEDMTDEECVPLSIWRGTVGEERQPIVLSCWKLTPEEWEEVRRTKRIWLMIWGPSMPPARLDGVSPFSSEYGQNENRSDGSSDS